MAAETARLFTAANSEYLTHADSVELSVPNGTQFTIGGFFYFNTLPGGGMHLIGKWGSTAEYMIWMNGAVPILQSASGTQNCTWGSSLSTGTWYFIVGGVNASGGFLNVNQGTPVTNASYNTADQANNFSIGAHNPSPSRYLDGRAQMCFFYKTTSATTTQLNDHYNSGSGKCYAALSDKSNMVSFWPCNEASGDALDSHGSNTLTDVNTVTSAAGLVECTAAGNTPRMMLLGVG